MTREEFEATVGVILNGDSAEAGDAASRLSDESTSENVGRLYELTSHENLFLAEMAACALARAAGPSSIPSLLHTSARCMAEGMDCDSLSSEIICLVGLHPDDALGVLKPLIHQRANSQRLAAIWAVSHIDRADAHQFLEGIINDDSESKEVRDFTTDYYKQP